MFNYSNTNLYLCDYFSGDETKVSESVFQDAIEWHKANRIKMNLCYHSTERYDFVDDTINVTTTHELRSFDYKACLNFLEVN